MDNNQSKIDHLEWQIIGYNDKIKSLKKELYKSKVGTTTHKRTIMQIEKTEYDILYNNTEISKLKS